MATKRRRKKSSGNSHILLALVAIIAILSIIGGFFYAQHKSKKDVFVPKDDDKQETTVISLMDESIEAQRLVDTILLTKNNWQLIENSSEEKEIAVEGSASSVKIGQRELAVGVPNTTSLAGAAEWLKRRIDDTSLVYISGEESTYKKWDGYKVEIGIETKAGDGTKSFVTDTITFFHNSNLNKEDKDVKDVPKTDKPQAKKYSGKLAVIIDDCGYDMKNVRALLDTKFPFSYAILPFKDYSSDVLAMVNEQGRVPMLHLPMEPMDKSAMSEGKSTVQVSMTADQQRALVRKAVNSLPGIMGVNNHQGSKATSDPTTMKNVLRELKGQNLFFVDSKTTGASKGRDIARSMGVPTARNDIFLDNSTNPEEIRKQIYKAFELADKNGSAIAICHARPGTAACWTKYADEFRKSGITFVPVTELLY